MATSVNTFNFIPYEQRQMYETAFNAITQLELWTFMRNFNDESFMFSSSPEVMRIYKKIEELGYNGHSGASFGCTMRAMEYISKNSVSAFQREYLQQQRTREQERQQQRQQQTIYLPQ